MKDYRQYKTLYKHIGFFALVAGVLLLAFKATNWAIFIGQCIKSSV